MDNTPTEDILRLKRAKNAVILAHNYQPPEVQDIADYVGDSLALSRTAAEVDAEVIVFCGVHFMAETAAILSPQKTVLLPDIRAGCPMADMITAEKLRALKKKHPKATVVGYINTSAAVKAEMDVCCTSSNAVKVVEALKDSAEVIFVPDKYLAAYVSKKTGRDLIAWDGYCPTHANIRAADILEQRRLHPAAKVVVHPESRPEVTELADEVMSTDGMRKYAKESSATEFVVGTEVGMLARLRKENPQKTFYPASEKAICPTMKLMTPQKVKSALEENKYRITVPEKVRTKAKKALDRMFEIG